MKKLLIFDLDGTVADTLGAITEALGMATDSLGLPGHTAAEVREFISYGTFEFAQASLPEGMRDDLSAVENMRKIYAGMYRKTYLHTRECYPGMAELLGTLSEHYLLALNSNKADDMVAALTAVLTNPGVFSVSCGVVDGRPPKPNPAGALYICRTLGVEPEGNIYVGDSDIDIATAKNAGMIPVSVTWGYKSEEQLLRAGARYCAHTPDGLGRIISNIFNETK